MQKPNSYGLGIKGEAIAEAWLRLKAFRIAEKRYKTPVGEIDLIARKGNLVCFIEVKAHQDVKTAVQAITLRQKQRISRAATWWLQKHPEFQNFDCRFDVLLVGFAGFRIQHLRNAWSLDEIGLA